MPTEIKTDHHFHEDLAQRINEGIQRILNEPPSEDQIASIQMMQEKLDTHYTYGCKAEANFVEKLLTEHLQKEQD
ncbi:hypothetical protein QT711_12760 [Sporosarcina saromensis]|uniref:YtzH-like protein n=1 Tax=Sporosarcina saromensis TaxID=359365 RepID=A0ABU4GAS1_9BACL|nr:hypothetical protein [Sporosarcina saromensis]MDW0114060.1 hypothetical protein [Sporosarcina saromensis]